MILFCPCDPAIRAITFWAEEQVNEGRPGRPETPALHGSMRVPSLGKLESGALVRITIQWASSHDFEGKIKDSSKLAPASSSMVSPQDARVTALATESPACSFQTLPGAGVSAMELLT